MLQAPRPLPPALRTAAAAAAAFPTRETQRQGKPDERAKEKKVVEEAEEEETKRQKKKKATPLPRFPNPRVDAISELLDGEPPRRSNRQKGTSIIIFAINEDDDDAGADSSLAQGRPQRKKGRRKKKRNEKTKAKPNSAALVKKVPLALAFLLVHRKAKKSTAGRTDSRLLERRKHTEKQYEAESRDADAATRKRNRTEDHGGVEACCSPCAIILLYSSRQNAVYKSLTN
ncbi:uncharacterized protein ARB_05651 [Trichophyton benhamiae CBS 112371]|uniref:Uncharacterized protein n=1 Tax=Arthroderma benhamiae (strain ATCC MYA-4681 / CBS 112371) TaxID=663331 RepID=D4AN47_ARTBC|nr:uncharacterized protein ARB_05651 [Trichophyton benhamiae CBS 112371]EFE35608.1 hypothetical protein ARB_05651 [Trichophyton benhamiae CBS 112371]